MATMTLKESVKALKLQGVSITGLPTPRKTLPKTNLGGIADSLHDVRELRLAVDKVASALKAEETRLTDHIIDTVDTSVSSGAVGKRYKALILEDSVAVVEDWDKLYAHILKKKDFTLLNKALSRSAVKELWEDGKAVPGVGSFKGKKLSVTKV